MHFHLMKSARFLVVALLPLLVACAAAVPAAVTYSPPDVIVTQSQAVEKTFRLVGYVLNEVSHEPISGVMVKSGYWVVGSSVSRTDVWGRFVMHLPVSFLNKGRQLQVHTMLYEGQAAIPTDTTQTVTLMLKRNAYRFKPFGCQQLADTVHIPPYVTMPILGYPGSQYAFFIRDTTARQPRQLRAITFRTGHAAFSREPFRLRIYQGHDNSTAPPSEELLLETLNIVPSQEEGVWTYDISSYNIKVSGTGFFIAMEYFVGDIHGWEESIAKYTPTGPILRPACARADIRTWEYVIGKGWQRATSAENCWPLYESAISVEVEPAPSVPGGR